MWLPLYRIQLGLRSPLEGGYNKRDPAPLEEAQQSLPSVRTQFLLSCNAVVTGEHTDWLVMAQLERSNLLSRGQERAREDIATSPIFGQFSNRIWYRPSVTLHTHYSKNHKNLSEQSAACGNACNSIISDWTTICDGELGNESA